MTLPASGAISLSQIATEYGGTLPHNLSEYYRGGAYVPNAPPNLSVPTSGAIKLTDFYGGAGTPPVDIASQSVIASGVTAGGSTARSRFNSSGTQQSKQGNSAYATDNTWLNSGSASDYDIRFTSTGSTGFGSYTGTVGSWVSLATDFEVSAVASGPGDYYVASFTVEIRLHSSGAVLASNTVTLESERP